LSDQHHQIDGVKVFLTTKTSGQVGLGVHGRVKAIAQRTAKTKTAFCHGTRDSQRFFDEHFNVNLVSHGIKLAGGKTPIGHVSLPDRVWVSN
jgi:hypothetical protein